MPRLARSSARSAASQRATIASSSRAELDVALDPARSLGRDPLDRGGDRGERCRELAQLGEVMIEIRLADLNARLRLGDRLVRGGGGAPGRPCRLEPGPRRFGPFARQALGCGMRRIGDEAELAERGELCAPVARERFDRGLRRSLRVLANRARSASRCESRASSCAISLVADSHCVVASASVRSASAISASNAPLCFHGCSIAPHNGHGSPSTSSVRACSIARGLAQLCDDARAFVARAAPLDRAPFSVCARRSRSVAASVSRSRSRLSSSIRMFAAVRAPPLIVTSRSTSPHRVRASSSARPAASRPSVRRLTKPSASRVASSSLCCASSRASLHARLLSRPMQRDAVV